MVCIVWLKFSGWPWDEDSFGIRFFVLCTLDLFNFRCCLQMWLCFFFIYISYILCISFRVRKFCMNIGLFHIYFMTTKYGCQKNFWEVGNICLCCLFLINLTKFNSYNQFNLTICIPDNFLLLSLVLSPLCIIILYCSL